MPQFNGVTKQSKEIWKSADGARTIWGVVLEVDGKQVPMKTYSQAIAVEGFSGAVESYEKPGKNGAETFVKQAPKEGGSYGGRSYGNKGQGDQFTMYLSYAKDIAVALIEKGDYAAEKLAEIVNDVGLAGEQLYGMRQNSEKSGDSGVQSQESSKETPTVTDEDIANIESLFS